MQFQRMTLAKNSKNEAAPSSQNKGKRGRPKKVVEPELKKSKSAAKEKTTRTLPKKRVKKFESKQTMLDSEGS